MGVGGAPVTPVDRAGNILGAAPATAGSAAPTSGPLIMGSDGTNARAVKTDSSGNLVTVSTSSEYETVAASQTAQIIGATGAAGDLLEGLLVIPATTSPGAITILDNATSITVFTGGATSVSSLVPFYIYLGVKSVSGAWKVTTGTNVSVIATGDFT